MYWYIIGALGSFCDRQQNISCCNCSSPGPWHLWECIHASGFVIRCITLTLERPCMVPSNKFCPFSSWPPCMRSVALKEGWGACIHFHVVTFHLETEQPMVDTPFSHEVYKMVPSTFFSYSLPYCGRRPCRCYGHNLAIAPPRITRVTKHTKR